MAKKDKQISTDGSHNFPSEAVREKVLKYEEKFKEWRKENPNEYQRLKSLPKYILIRSVIYEKFALQESLKLGEQWLDLQGKEEELLKKTFSISKVSPKLFPSIEEGRMPVGNDLAFELIMSLMNNVLKKQNNASNQIAEAQPKGVKKIKKRTASKRAKLKKAVKDLTTSPEARLLYPKKEDVADFLYNKTSGWRKKYKGFYNFKKIVGQIIAELELEAKKPGLVSSASR